MHRRLIAVLALIAAAGPAARAEDDFFLQDGQRVAFLGDSNTFAGHYIAYLDAYLFTRFPDRKYELLNLGLPSETASGLSEPDHPYPRPDVHERLDRVLAKTKPDVVVLCYGMNDGIYYPFSEDRFKKYQDGMLDVIDRVTKAGAKVVVVTPPPFDPGPIRDKLLAKTADKFSWMHPYEGYDDVLQRYSDWMLTLRDKGLMVVDAHAAVSRHVAEVRKLDPKYCLSGDGVHIDASGHWLVAQAILRVWGAPADLDVVEINAKTGKISSTSEDVKDFSADSGGFRFTRTMRLPVPADPAWNGQIVEKPKIDDKRNRPWLKVSDAPFEKYTLYEGDKKLGEIGRDRLDSGLDLTEVKDLSINVRAAQLGKLAAERSHLLGLAWLTDVGYKRPDTPKGIPLDEAQKKAGDLEAKIRKLAEPQALMLRLVPVDK
ncbi:MAG TPA: SGNH/GDSL hydrolase family protein [Gemmataceae bacterium]|nr:SGNH/GDSL hydrolase family protein [Gemmataceae bacterium]